ncbi:MAG: LysM peptidoglycan-binding domain-containing protein [Blastocatellia bacterium]|nr:LysM peptidoglycan-binding domain-containing protein [Blastocatellia bacterium]
MADLEALKSKYSAVIDTAAEVGMDVHHIHIQEEKLYLSGLVASESAKNAIWDEVKRINPAFDDIWPDINVGAGKYTVQSGDTLSKIAKRVYGDANAYHQIFNANTDKLSDPDRIQVGQELVLPAA